MPDTGQMSQESESTAAKSLLTQPDQFLPALAEAIQDELAFYTRDMEGRFTYLSKSAEHVLNRSREGLIDRHFCDALTDNPCNEPIRAREWRGPGARQTKGQICEFYDRDGNRIQLKYWQAIVIHNGVPIGLSGVMRRLQDRDGESDGLSAAEEKSLMERVGLLTSVEREVIELVVDGNMNKKMAMILDVAVRTIESRRSRAMMKLQAGSLSELVQIWVLVRRIESRWRTANIRCPESHKNSHAACS